MTREDWAAATASTVKLSDEVVAELLAVAVTEVALAVALTAFQESASEAVVAAVASEAILVLRVCSALTVDDSVACLFFSRVCGAASSCISWLMMLVVSSPLTRPEIDVVPDMTAPSSARTRPVADGMPARHRRLA